MKKICFKYAFITSVFILKSCSSSNPDIAAKKSDKGAVNKTGDNSVFNSSLHSSSDQKGKNPENWIYGIWKIDSVAENNVIVQRFSSQDKYQGFHFDTDNELFSVSKDKYRASRELGYYLLDGDSIFFLNKQKHAFQKYSFLSEEDKLILIGNFSISKSNSNKPTFYLSKVKK